MVTNDRVEFYRCSQAEYDSATKSANTLYFTTDTHRIYKGEDLYSGTGGSGSAVQSDYAMNNPNDLSYIKNREFYTEETSVEYPGKHIVVTQDMVDNGFYNGTMFNIADGPLGLVEGKEYTVTLSTLSEPLKITAANTQVGGSTYIGLSNDTPYFNVIDNCKISGSGHDITYAVDNTNYVLDLDEPTAGMSIAISGEGISPTTVVTTVVHKMPSKYLTQSDYDVEDSTDIAYIKNRPFYTEILSGKSYTVTQADLDSSLQGLAIYKPALNIVAGEYYTVVFGDVTFENCKAINPKDEYGADDIDCTIIECESNLFILDKFRATRYIEGTPDDNICTIMQGSTPFEVGQTISVIGKIEEPNNKNYDLINSNSGLVKYTTGAFGLIEGESYTVTLGEKTWADCIATNLQKNSSYAGNFSTDTFGFTIDGGLQSSTGLLIADKCKINFAEGKFDANPDICSVLSQSFPSGEQKLSISGKFMPPTIEKIHPIDKKYLPGKIPSAPFHKQIVIAGKKLATLPTHTPADTELSNVFKTFDRDKMFYWAKFSNANTFQLFYTGKTSGTEMANGADTTPIGDVTFTVDSNTLYNARLEDLGSTLVYFSYNEAGTGLDMYYYDPDSRPLEDLNIPDNLRYLDIDLYSTSVEYDPLHLDKADKLYVTPYHTRKYGIDAGSGTYCVNMTYSVDDTVNNTSGIGVYPVVGSNFNGYGVEKDNLCNFNFTGIVDTDIAKNPSKTYLTASIHNHIRAEIVNSGNTSEIVCNGFTTGVMINPSPVENINSRYGYIDSIIGSQQDYQNKQIGTPLGLVEGKYYKVGIIQNNVEVANRVVKAENLKNSTDTNISGQFTYNCIGLVYDSKVYLADSSEYDPDTKTFSQSDAGFSVKTGNIIGITSEGEKYTIEGPDIVGTKVKDIYKRPNNPRYCSLIPISSRGEADKYSDIEFDLPNLPGDVLILHGEYADES